MTGPLDGWRGSNAGGWLLYRAGVVVATVAYNRSRECWRWNTRDVNDRWGGWKTNKNARGAEEAKEEAFREVAKKRGGGC